MKKILLCMLALVTILTFAACKNDDGNESDTVSDTTSETTGESESGTTSDPSDLAAAKEYLETIYKDESTITATDYERIPSLRVGGVTYTLTWTVDNDAVKVVVGEKSVTIDVDEKNETEFNYVLTATITDAAGNSVQVNFERTVPAYKVNTYEEYLNAKEGDNLVVVGVVSGINAKSLGNKYNHIFLVDEEGKGGYYSYNMDADPAKAGIQVGMTVSITGPASPYSGMQEIKGGVAAIIDKTIKEVPAVDITSVIENATSETSYAKYVGMRVTIKGVEIGSQVLDVETSQYLYFSKGSFSSYLRTYKTDMILGSTDEEKAAAKTTIDTAHAEKFGWTANVTGICVLYNGNPYLIPVGTDCFEYLNLVEKTPAEKVATEKDALSLTDKVMEDTVLDLPTKGQYYPDDVTIAWVSDSEYAVVADGKLTITVPEDGATATITATITCGTETATQTFTVKISKSATSISEAVAIGAAKEHNTYTEGKYVIAGVITDLQNTTYGNMVITDASGASILVYGTYDADGTNRYDAMATKPVLGDYVVVLGVLGQYNGTAQMKNGWITTHIAATSIADAVTTGSGKESNTYTDDKYIISGTITEIKNETYGNVIISDGNGNTILIYGMYSADGSTRYDAMTTKPAVGDTVTLFGVLGQYNGTAQMKNGWLVAHTVAPSEGGSNDDIVADATLKFNDKSLRIEYSDSVQKWSDNGITVINEQAGSTATIGDYADPVRFYKSTSLTVEYTGMKTVVFVCDAIKGTDGFKVTIEGATITMDGNNVTIAFENAVDSFTIDTIPTQVRVISVSVSK